MKRTALLIVCVMIILGSVSCRPRARPGQEPFPAARQEDNAVNELPIPVFINYMNEGGRFELPVSGSTGFAAVRLNLREAPGTAFTLLYTMSAGQPFTVLREEGDWWFIELPAAQERNARQGWVMKRYTMINLPDIIPSIVYNNTNTYYSLFRSSGIAIPNITGAVLYHASDFNERLGREEFIMPALYGMALRIMAAQQAALADGRTLVIYEAFRPHDAHQKVYENFAYLFDTNQYVRDNIVTSGFTRIRFLAPSPWNHQRGTAIDVSLARIHRKETNVTGDFSFTLITEYIEYEMQSPMHELSVASAIFVQPVVTHSLTDWKRGVFRDDVTEGTFLLIEYMTGAGLTPLSSEWWHFNDIETTDAAIAMGSVGRFQTERTFSRPPVSN